MLQHILTQKVLASFMAAGLLLAVAAPAGLAETVYKKVYNSDTGRYEYVPTSNSWKNRTVSQAKSAWRNPLVKQAAIGAAVGLGTGLLSDRTTVGKGIGVGALTGLGTGLISSSRSLDNHPVIRTALKGTAIGTGASVLTGGGIVKGAAVGTAAGAGVHYVKKYLDNRRDNSDNGSWW